MKKPTLILFALVIALGCFPISACAEGENTSTQSAGVESLASESVGTVSENEAPTESSIESGTPKTGDMLNIIAFILLAASAVAMMLALFPKNRSF